MCIQRRPTHTAEQSTETHAACDDVCGREVADGLLIFQSLWVVFIHMGGWGQEIALEMFDLWFYETCFGCS